MCTSTPHLRRVGYGLRGLVAETAPRVRPGRPSRSGLGGQAGPCGAHKEPFLPWDGSGAYAAGPDS